MQDFAVSHMKFYDTWVSRDIGGEAINVQEHKGAKKVLCSKSYLGYPRTNPMILMAEKACCLCAPAFYQKRKGRGGWGSWAERLDPKNLSFKVSNAAYPTSQIQPIKSQAM